MRLTAYRVAVVTLLVGSTACRAPGVATGPRPLPAPAAPARGVGTVDATAPTEVAASDTLTGFPETPVVPTVGPSSAAAVADAVADSIRHPYTAADVEFMSGMIGHHAQAIAMARLAPERAGTETIRTLAARIINAQVDEIRTMQSWLADRRQPVPPANPNGMTHEMGGMTHTMLMPGMLMPDQVAELARSRGAAFDERFLRFMIQHHRGATAMVRQLFSAPGAGEDELVFKFASDVNVDQSTEIARMEQMLVAVVLQRGLP